jgi:hypothetical protein
MYGNSSSSNNNNNNNKGSSASIGKSASGQDSTTLKK